MHFQKKTNDMKKIIFSLLVLPVAFVVSCNSGSTDSKTTDSTEVAEKQNDQKFDSTNMERDADFAVFAADGGMAEVMLGKLAMSNAGAKNIKDLGKMLADDHQKAGDELKLLAQQYNITLPGAVSTDLQK